MEAERALLWKVINIIGWSNLKKSCKIPMNTANIENPEKNEHAQRKNYANQDIYIELKWKKSNEKKVEVSQMKIIIN